MADFQKKSMTSFNSKKWILIADSHLTGDQNTRTFFHFLDYIHHLPNDTGVVFLGDIFDLWIALPGYETPFQKEFAEWSTKEKKIRAIVFLEGNHEFFVQRTRKHSFSACARKTYQIGQVMFTHGDLINPKDIPYFLLYHGLRNPFSRLIMRVFGFIMGPAIAKFIRKFLKNKNMKNKVYFPEQEIRHTMSNLPEQVKMLVCGHFHSHHVIQDQNGLVEIIPAFMNEGEYAVLDEESSGIELKTWRDSAGFQA